MAKKAAAPKPAKLGRNARYIQRSYAAQDANRTARAARKALNTDPPQGSR